MTSLPHDDESTVYVPSGPSPTLADGDTSAPGAHCGDALPTGTFLGEFELTGVLGEGGFGIVYAALDRSLGRLVAVKEYMPSSLAERSDQSQIQVKSERYLETFQVGLKSFVNEARLLAQFDHPSLVKVYRFWEANGTAYMVMPYYRGLTLKKRLRELQSPPDEAWLMSLLAPLTEALVVIHAEDCLHRDIAPDNVILLEGSGKPLLLDFGAARRVIGDRTQALTVILKQGYAPIEQYDATSPMKQGPWTDVYALAATVYFAITGKTPPPSVGRLLDDTYVPLSEAGSSRYSKRFCGAIDGALRVRPEARPQSVADFRADLGLPSHVVATGDAYPLPAADDAPPRRTDTSFGRRGQIGVLIAFVACVAVVAAGARRFAVFKGEPATPAASAASATRTATSTPERAMPAEPALRPSSPQGAAEAPGLPAGDIATRFDSLLLSQTRGFSVRAGSERPSLRIGKDRLSLSIESSRDGYVQLLSLDPNGDLVLLFPNLRSPTNRIRAGQSMKLPQQSWPLVATGPAGMERFLVIVSGEPRSYASPAFEPFDIFRKWNGASRADVATPRADAAAARWLLGTTVDCRASDCDDFGAARLDVELKAL
jgi:serine/threonine protein kinase